MSHVQSTQKCETKVEQVVSHTYVYVPALGQLSSVSVRHTRISQAEEGKGVRGIKVPKGGAQMHRLTSGVT